MRKMWGLLLGLAAALHLPACGQESVGDKVLQNLYKNTVPQIKPAELKSQKDSTLILDTRSYAEYQVSRIQGALFVGFEDFDKEKVAHISKDSRVVVYCSVGYRSERIGEQMQQLGFKNVKNLYGGIFDWKNQGYDVVNIYNQPTDSVHAYNRFWGQWLQNATKVYE